MKKHTWMLLLSVVLSVNTKCLANAVQPDFSTCITPSEPTTDPSVNQGYNFPGWASLKSAQQALATATDYTELTVKENGKATNFLALTQALSQLSINLGDQVISGVDIIETIKEIKSDRIFVTLNMDLVKKWQATGGKYSLQLASQKLETGHVEFFDHTTHDAGLHCGFNLQWYTNTSKTPHLHWNMRLTDGYADIHLDGFKAWYFEVIPDFKHLSYANSDVRYWFNKFKKKYGPPEFLVRKVR